MDNTMIDPTIDREQRIQHAMDFLCDIIPWSTPNYEKELRKAAESYIDWEDAGCPIAEPDEVLNDVLNTNIQNIGDPLENDDILSEPNFLNEQKDWTDNYIPVGKLKDMLKDLDDNDMITVKTLYKSETGEHKIKYVEDTTCIGFWEIRCE